MKYHQGVFLCARRDVGATVVLCPHQNAMLFHTCLTSGAPSGQVSRCRGPSPGEGHGEGLDGDGVEVEDARVQVDGRQRPARDDNRLELLEHRPHRQARIQATQLRSPTSMLSIETGMPHPWKAVSGHPTRQSTHSHLAAQTAQHRHVEQHNGRAQQVLAGSIASPQMVASMQAAPAAWAHSTPRGVRATGMLGFILNSEP